MRVSLIQPWVHPTGEERGDRNAAPPRPSVGKELIRHKVTAKGGEGQLPAPVVVVDVAVRLAANRKVVKGGTKKCTLPCTAPHPVLSGGNAHREPEHMHLDCVVVLLALPHFVCLLPSPDSGHSGDIAEHYAAP